MLFLSVPPSSPSIQSSPLPTQLFCSVIKVILWQFGNLPSFLQSRFWGSLGTEISEKENPLFPKKYQKNLGHQNDQNVGLLSKGNAKFLLLLSSSSFALCSSQSSQRVLELEVVVTFFQEARTQLVVLLWAPSKSLLPFFCKTFVLQHYYCAFFCSPN